MDFNYSILQNALIVARLHQRFPQVDERVIAAVPSSAREELFEASRLYLDDVDSVFLFRKAKLTPLTLRQQRRLVSNLLRLPSVAMVERL